MSTTISISEFESLTDFTTSDRAISTFVNSYDFCRQIITNEKRFNRFKQKIQDSFLSAYGVSCVEFMAISLNDLLEKLTTTDRFSYLSGIYTEAIKFVPEFSELPKDTDKLILKTVTEMIENNEYAPLIKTAYELSLQKICEKRVVLQVNSHKNKITESNWLNFMLPQTTVESLLISKDIIDAFELEIINLARQLVYARQDLNKRNRAVVNLREKNKELKSQLIAANNTIESLLSEVEENKKIIKSLNTDIAKANDSALVNDLTKALEENKLNYIRLERRYNALQEKFQNFKDKHLSVESEELDIVNTSINNTDNSNIVDFNNRFVFIGEYMSENQTNKLLQVFPNSKVITNVRENLNANTDFAVVCLISSISHAFEAKFKNQCKSKNIHFIPTSSLNPDLIKKDISEFFAA